MAAKVDPEVKKLWVEALRSENYKQGERSMMEHHITTKTNGLMSFDLDTEFDEPIPLSEYMRIKRMHVGDVFESVNGEVLLIGNASINMQVSDSDGEEGWLWSKWSWFRIKRIWRLTIHSGIVTPKDLTIANQKG